MIAGYGVVIPDSHVIRIQRKYLSPRSGLGKRCRWVRNLATRRITGQRPTCTQAH